LKTGKDVLDMKRALFKGKRQSIVDNKRALQELHETEMEAITKFEETQNEVMEKIFKESQTRSVQKRKRLLSMQADLESHV
jgi:hypothetical protein